jgi:hypothetical protein
MPKLTRDSVSHRNHLRMSIRSVTRQLATPVLGIVLVGCTAADNLTYAEITTELDGIVHVEGTGASRRITYAERANISSWYMRSPVTWPLRWPLGLILGGRHEADLENAAGHVHELIVELPDEAGSDLAACADAAVRLALLAELDPGVGTQIVAIDALARICEQVQAPVLVGEFTQVGVLADPTLTAAARAAVQLGRPDRRSLPEWTTARAENYRAGIASLVDRPLPVWSERLSLIGDLIDLWRQEPDPELRTATATAVRLAIGHSLQLLLVRAVQGRDPQLADVRLCAMQQLRRLGGPRVVPLLLAIMAAPSSDVRGGVERFDPDPLVQLRLIHLCGQLRGDLAMQALRLPNRADWEPIAPVDFLCQTILNERDYFSKLRVPALTALSLCLERERIDYDLDWVAVWFREHQSHS